MSIGLEIRCSVQLSYEPANETTWFCWPCLQAFIIDAQHPSRFDGASSLSMRRLLANHKNRPDTSHVSTFVKTLDKAEHGLTNIFSHASAPTNLSSNFYVSPKKH